MLKTLTIKNYIIIDHLSVSFKNGLTVITGETGAGKSIVLGALSLLLGERADAKTILSNQSKCILEAIFDISKIESAKLLLERNDFDWDNELIIRREISAEGKSRAYINDSPATLQVLAGLGSILVDLHRQFDSQELQQKNEQLSLVDALCKHDDVLSTYQHEFKIWKKIQEEYTYCVEHNRQLKGELDYNTFLFEELNQLNLKPNELEEIDAELNRLNQSEALKSTLASAVYQLKESDQPVLSVLKSIAQQLTVFGTNDKRVLDLHGRILSSHLELKEIANDLDVLFDNTFFDQERIYVLNERLSEGHRLLKKHNVLTTSDLIEIKVKLEQKIAAATSSGEEEKLRLLIGEKMTLLQELASILSTNRRNASHKLVADMKDLMQKVGMPNARLEVQLEKAELKETGFDKIDILFDANKSGKLVSISKAASGGELSRLMLCLKSLLAESSALPTLIFDEIDTGISGEIALQVGEIMRTLSRKHQLICITHLPQIAGKATQHLYVYKQENTSNQIQTLTKELNDQERIEVLAEMIGGKSSSKQVKETVRQLMN